MLQQTNYFVNGAWIYDQVKYWIFVGGVFFALFEGIRWVKAIKTNDLAHIHSEVGEIKKEINDQTTSFIAAIEKNTNEIRELRGDMKLIIGSLMGIPSQFATARPRTKRDDTWQSTS